MAGLIFWPSAAMRWLMIGLLVSLGALLLAAAGVARHIWLHHKKVRDKALPGDRTVLDRTDLESEP
jgi:hypothetical protein